MVNVIDVLHFYWNIEKLIGFIDSEYGTPESLMLELPSDWREYADRIIAEKYFQQLTNEYERRGTRIIAGDKNRYVVEPKPPQQLLDFEEKLRKNEWNPETLTEWTKGFLLLVKEYARYKSLLAWNLLSLSKGRIRNQGFLDVYNQTNPELTVVGASHGRFLKNHRPDINYTFFMTDSFVERAAFPVHYIAGSAKADSYAILSAE